jgi:hypothetical protein
MLHCAVLHVCDNNNILQCSDFKEDPLRRDMRPSFPYIFELERLRLVVHTRNNLKLQHYAHAQQLAVCRWTAHTVTQFQTLVC